TGGTTNVLAGGTAHNLTVSSGGTLRVEGRRVRKEGGLTGGVENVSYSGAITGGIGSGTGIFGGTEDVVAGGADRNVCEVGGGMLNVLGTITSNVTVFSGGVENVSSGGVVTGVPNSGTAVSGGTVNVLSGGSFAFSTDFTGGTTNVLAGGTAHNLTVSSGGTL